MSHTPSHSSSTNTPVFTPAFGASYMDDNDDVDEQFGYALSLDSPANEFVFANDLANDDDNEFHTYEDDDKAACMRSMPQRDTAIAFDPMMMRSEAFMEASVPTNGKAPLFVLNTAPLSPTLGESGNFEFFLPTISKHSKAKANVASPLSPSAYISTIEVPEKERSEFYSVNPAFTSHESPAKIMETVKTALSSLKCEFTTSEAWTLNVNCLLVAELITFSINVFQLRGMSAKYEIEFVRKSGDELVFADLAEHIRSRCNEIDEDGALSLFSKTLEPWMDDKQELTGRRYAIKETEALNLIEELNCEHLHVDTLYHVARSVKNHCRHKGNRKLFVQGNDQHKNFLKGLKWMLNDCDELVRFALFVLLQFASDEELCSSFFSTPFEKSSFALQLDALLAQDSRGSSTFTSEMVGAVQHSPLFA